MYVYVYVYVYVYAMRCDAYKRKRETETQRLRKAHSSVLSAVLCLSLLHRSIKIEGLAMPCDCFALFC